MPQNDVNQKNRFTGFVVHYEDGTEVFEKESYLSPTLQKLCATSWVEVDKTKITSLELRWQGQSKIILNKDELALTSPDDWFFTQSGYKDSTKNDIVVVARNIGYVDNDVIHVFSVEERTGVMRTSIRANRKKVPISS